MRDNCTLRGDGVESVSHKSVSSVRIGRSYRNIEIIGKEALSDEGRFDTFYDVIYCY